ncbi:MULTISPECIES: NnrU family protein [unclassified Rhizobium]|uniref:NnrU family protein n=1 Tax=unclassified Rhizobium TaxID=2613769 RepID=UPI001C8395AB|nr:MULTISPECIES: NnrU family protein [unclassified Rhizobium]MBX5215776.1 NnrU family protein [Rhizobium sp. NLR9a]MBX5222678.1 NnrU family protein [Rhizobium sp. NLR8a]MBX5246474.1 NnrU family protein [Rhizobium sp. NLR3b]MBX5277076.1 NnrU family protein [Rhizobium sp. NLR13a]MBX5283158.1 NnrU family protein [Rhizobium sp. NLR10a]
MALLIVGIILFLGVHLVRVVAPDLRRSMIARLGENGWRAGYSVASILTLILLIYGFGQARQVTGMLYNPPVWMAHITITLMLIALICLVASLLPAGYIATKTKHPMVLSVKIWALAHLLANGETSSVLLFAAFLAWGVIVRISLKRRERAGEIRRRPFVSAKYDLYALVIGIVVWALIIWKLHEWLIGVSPLAM